MTDIQLTEHGPATVIADLPEATVSVLRAYLRVTSAGSGRWRLKPRGKVGMVRVGDLTVRIEPKLRIEHLLFLISYAVKPVDWLEPIGDAKEITGLVAAVADVYSQCAETTLRQGVLHGYHPVRGPLPVVRGRIRATDQLRNHHGAPFPFEVSYDAFSSDIRENQILRAAAVKALKLPQLTETARNRLAVVIRLLERVSALPDSGPASPLVHPTPLLNRGAERYRVALGLADLILRGSSFDLHRGSVTAHGFMLDMDVVFENFLGAALKKALPERIPGVGRVKHSLYLDAAGRLRAQLDFAWLVNDRPCIVVDAKYKLSKKKHRPDIYQMATYCSALNLSGGHLVYAEGPIQPTVHRLKNSGIRITHHALDLSRPSAEILTAVDALADHLAAGIVVSPQIQSPSPGGRP